MANSRSWDAGVWRSMDPIQPLIMAFGKRKNTKDKSSPSTIPAMASKPAFTTFAKLPARLQLKIWNHARPESRVIQLYVSTSKNFIYSTAPVPSLLHVCRESRAAACNGTGYCSQRETVANPVPSSMASPRSISVSPEMEFVLDAGVALDQTVFIRRWPKITRRSNSLFEAPLSFMPFQKIACWYPGVEGSVLIRGKSTVTDSFGGVWEGWREVPLAGWRVEPYASVLQLIEGRGAKAGQRVSIKEGDKNDSPWREWGSWAPVEPLQDYVVCLSVVGSMSIMISGEIGRVCCIQWQYDLQCRL